MAGLRVVPHLKLHGHVGVGTAGDVNERPGEQPFDRHGTAEPRLGLRAFGFEHLAGAGGNRLAPGKREGHGCVEADSQQSLHHRGSVNGFGGIGFGALVAQTEAGTIQPWQDHQYDSMFDRAVVEGAFNIYLGRKTLPPCDDGNLPSRGDLPR